MKPAVRARSIPGVSTDCVRVGVVASEGGRRHVHLSIDAAAVARGPIHRGEGPPFLRGVRDGQPIRIESAAAQRQGFLPVTETGATHISRFLSAHPARRVVAVTGHGNLGMNAGVLARVKDVAHGVIGDFGGALHLRNDGRLSLGSWSEAIDDGCLLTGPLLVVNSRPRPIRAAEFADPRHLLLFPYVKVAGSIRIDFGHDRLLANPSLYAEAVAGNVITLPLDACLPATDSLDAPLATHALDTSALHAALGVKGYVDDPSLSARGTYTFAAASLHLRFLCGIYPHHVLAALPDGTAASIVISGLSNRAGVVLTELAEDLARAGIVHALLLDNGGDVGLFLAQEGRFEIPPSESDRAATWPLSACLLYHEAAGAGR